MKDSQSTHGTFRRNVIGGCSLLLVSGGVILLSMAAMAHFRATATGTPSIPAVNELPVTPSAGEHTLTGKLLPTQTLDSGKGFPDVPPAIEQQPAPDRAAADFDHIISTIPPLHDYFSAAEELGRVDLGDRVLTPSEYRVGDQAVFNTADGPREAELVYVDDLAAYWVETGLALNQAHLSASAERLRTVYYPLLSHLIGREWRPGVDGDPRFTVLHVRSAPETSELGYFTDENQYPRSLFGDSNEREMIYMNMSLLETGTPLYDGTLVHEVQHLIQWNIDANEDKWLNEGLSQLAETISGLDTVDPQPYLERTDIQLNQWEEDPTVIHAHYAAGYLYLLYLQQQLGDVALSELARHPANGLTAVRAVLAGHRPALSLERFTADWAAALYLDGRTADPRYNVQGFDLPKPFFADRVRQLPFETVASLDQYAVDFIDLDFSGPAIITFAGDTSQEILGKPPEGSFWYAPPSNTSRSQLTATVDLPEGAVATLSFSSWYELEPGYDFAYLSVSVDGGKSWRLLEPDHATLGAYGPAWNGHSAEAAGGVDGWVNETIDLDAYGGQQILLRFEVLTDFEVLGQGFALSSPFISGLAQQPEWRPDGFVETGGLASQRWEVVLIKDGESPEVLPVALDGLNRARVEVDLGPEGGALVIVPLTPFVEATANYWLSVNQ